MPSFALIDVTDVHWPTEGQRAKARLNCVGRFSNSSAKLSALFCFHSTGDGTQSLAHAR